MSGRPRGGHQDKKKRGNGRHEGKGRITRKSAGVMEFFLVFYLIMGIFKMMR